MYIIVYQMNKQVNPVQQSREEASLYLPPGRIMKGKRKQKEIQVPYIVNKKSCHAVSMAFFLQTPMKGDKHTDLELTPFKLSYLEAILVSA